VNFTVFAQFCCCNLLNFEIIYLRHLKVPSHKHQLPENTIESKNRNIIEEVIMIS